jgi:hypothetical protein
MKMAVFWVVAPCSVAEVTDVSDGLSASIIRAIIEAANTSETPVNVYQTARRNNPEDIHLQINPRLSKIAWCSNSCHGY